MQKIKEITKNESGQMVIIVLLVLVVALTIGLSVISRTITNTKLSTNTELANRAYSAAEAGIERALTGASETTGTISTETMTTNFTISKKQLGTSPEQFDFPNPVAKDETVQIWLFDYASFETSSIFPSPRDGCPTDPSNPSSSQKYFNCTNKILTVFWGTHNETAPDTQSDTTPALEITALYLDNSNNFGIEKCAYDPNATRAATNNFLSVSTQPATNDEDFCNQRTAGKMEIAPQAGFGTGTKYNFQKRFFLGSVESTNRRYLLMRIKPLYNQEKQKIGVLPRACTNQNCTTTTEAALPSQGTIIDSEGSAGNIIRKIRVYQSYPTLPGIFDFVLYNGSNNPLSK